VLLGRQAPIMLLPPWTDSNSIKGMTMKTANMILRLTSAAILCVLCATVYAQEKPYTEGSVWYISMIRVKPGMLDVYMREVLPLRKKINEEAKKQGLAVSDHIFTGNSMGRDDWDVMFMTEFKNWAALDGITAKYDAIASKVIGSEDKQVQLMTKRTETREIIGNKTMQELIIK
jgi:hypothetical protein